MSEKDCTFAKSMKNEDMMDCSRVLMAGPCSAETEEQVLSCARSLAAFGDALPANTRLLFRAGLWKPRTSPHSFEGVGEAGLAWLRKVEIETGLAAATEVATPAHLRLCLDSGLRHLWIGARTTANPIMVQQIADTLHNEYADLSGSLTLFVKNPVNPELALWIGAIERLQKAGVEHITAVHRGFSAFHTGECRNTPLWSIALELRRRMPGLPLLCDISHIAGKRALLTTIAQTALNLGFEGLMVEVHPSPAQALSDAAQQLTPDAFACLLHNLRMPAHRACPSDDRLAELRQRIDEIDDALWQLVVDRQQVSQDIGRYKQEHNLPVFQEARYRQLLDRRMAWAARNGLSEETVQRIMEALHEASIGVQLR